VLLGEVVDASAAVAATRSRTAKIGVLADLLRGAAAQEVAPVVSWLSGELTQRQLGVGWAVVRERPAVAAERTLTVAEVEAAFSAIGTLAGPGSVQARRRAVGELLGRADEPEQAFLVRLLLGDLRQGALAGVMTEAVAVAASVPAAEVRRALTLHGDLAAIAAIALGEGAPGLAAVRLQVGRPLAPMLAGTAADVSAALSRTAPAVVDWKIDGARVQVHRDGADVAIFTRTLDDVTARLPEVAAAVSMLPARSIVLDGEAIALRADGTPRPFQTTMRRFGRKSDAARVRAELPIRPFFFDALYVDGAPLVDEPLSRRAQVLADLVPAAHLVPRLVTASPADAEAFAARAASAGHEGVMAKALVAAYAAGRRGSAWLKIKRAHTLDLVVLAVEWGSGRRRGTLSNLHLGARDAERGGFVMLGKTFKGLTDQMLAWQTQALLALETGRDAHVVFVRPALVVEIAFNDIQASPQYPGGLALRFARVKRYRPDKRAEEADTLSAIQRLYTQTTGLEPPPRR
jgi:DNA ligase-1